jgi:RNA polymerase sigma factor (sigma-70 family)
LEFQTSLGERGAHWANLVDRIEHGDKTAEEMLCKEFQRGVTLIVKRALRESNAVGDLVNDVLIAAITNIRRGYVQDGRTLPGYIRTITHRRIAAEIQELQRRRKESTFEHMAPIADDRPTPEQRRISSERHQFAVRILASLPKKQREILRRFYLEEQTPDQICAEMGLTDTQFRLLKSRAKERFGQLGRKHMIVARVQVVASELRRAAAAGGKP